MLYNKFPLHSYNRFSKARSNAVTMSKRDDVIKGGNLMFALTSSSVSLQHKAMADHTIHLKLLVARGGNSQKRMVA